MVFLVPSAPDPSPVDAGNPTARRNAAEARVYDAFATRLHDPVAALVGQYRSSRGKDAVDGLQPLLDQVRQLTQTAEDGLDDPGERALFERLAGPFLGGQTAVALRHAAGECRAFEASASDGFVRCQIADAASAAADDRAFRQALLNATTEVDAFGRQSGHGRQEISQRRAVVIDALWRARLQALAQSDPAAAAKLFAANRRALSPDSRATLAGTLTQAAALARARGSAAARIDTITASLAKRKRTGIPGGNDQI
jgi:hypothetical protein